MMSNKKSQLNKTLLIKEFENENVFNKPIGVGTIVENVLNKFGITEERFKTAFGLDDCNCKQRKKWLDEMITLYHKKELLD
jgi:hypothetical protein